MKKTFQLTDENKKQARVIENIKHQIKKYVKRERSKKLPNQNSRWEFDCKFGKSATDCMSVIVPDISKLLDIAQEQEWSECYIEIVSKILPTKSSIK